MAKTKTIKIAGKEVQIAYCYATEIAFFDLTGKDYSTFLRSTVDQQSANPKDIMCAVLAAIMAYYQASGEESPINDHDLMFEATNEEISEAFRQVVMLFSEWYKLPSGEPKTKKKGPKGKN